MGERRVVSQGNPGAGARSGRHPSRAERSRVASRRLLFGEGEARGALSPPGLESGGSELWKWSVGRDHPLCAGSGPEATRIVTQREASDAAPEVPVCRRPPLPFCAAWF